MKNKKLSISRKTSLEIIKKKVVDLKFISSFYSTKNIKNFFKKFCKKTQKESFKNIFCYKSAHPFRLKHLLCSWSFSIIKAKHFTEQMPQLSRYVTRHFELSLHHFRKKCFFVNSFKGKYTYWNSVYDDAKRPYICGFPVIPLSLYNLRCDIMRSSTKIMQNMIFSWQLSTKSEVN